MDVRIIRCMGIRPYAAQPKDPDALKPSHIAKQIGASVNTVKSRIVRMEESGVIGGYSLVPNLRHLGLTGAAYHFGAPTDDKKNSVIDRIKSLDGALELHDFLGGGFCIDFTYSDKTELDATLSSYSELTQEDRPVKFYDRDMPIVNRALTSLDWRILRPLRKDGKRSLDEIGEELGVTGRTVRSRYARMATEGSFFSVPVLDPSKTEGLVLFEILGYLKKGEFISTARKLLKSLEANRIYAYVPSSPELGHLDLLLFAHTTGQVEELRQQAAAIPGVERAEAMLFRGMHDLSGWMDGVIDARIQSLTP